MKESPAAFVFPSRSGPLAREIPDIFIPLARNENSGMTVVGVIISQARSDGAREFYIAEAAALRFILMAVA